MWYNILREYANILFLCPKTTQRKVYIAIVFSAFEGEKSWRVGAGHAFAVMLQ